MTIRKSQITKHSRGQPSSRRKGAVSDREYIEGETGLEIARISKEKDPDKAQRRPTRAPAAGRSGKRAA